MNHPFTKHESNPINQLEADENPMEAQRGEKPVLRLTDLSKDAVSVWQSSSKISTNHKHKIIISKHHDDMDDFEDVT